MKSRFVTILLILFVTMSFATSRVIASGDTPDAPLAVIGSGTAASCQTQAASNALSTAVAAGGSITFNCGSVPVVMIVNTNATDKTVTVDGGGLVTLSGENLRQIFFVFGNGNLTLKNISLIDGNGVGGGAIAVSCAQAKATIGNSFLTGNDAGSSHGGAILNQGTLTIDHSTLGSNKTTSYGGAIFNNGGTVTISYSTIINNQAADGGAIFHSEGTINVDRSAIRSNIATMNGGGIHIDVGTVNVTNTTFYDNRADGGGGIYMRGNQLSIANSTFNRNRANTGGALWNFAGQTNIKNTILSGSRDMNDTSASLNCDGFSVTSGGRNIVSDNTCVPNPSSVGDLLSTDPKLDAFLRDNGGPTRTFKLLDGSPAIDYGLNCPNIDKRGVKRPIGTACDVGAFEYGWPTYLPVLLRK